MIDSSVIVICIDESGSMSGARWNNAVKGAKDLIEFIKNNHEDKEKIHLVVILFDDESRIIND